MTPSEFVDRYPLTSVSVAFLAGVSASSGLLSGRLAGRLAERGGPAAVALHQMVSTARPMVRAMAIHAARRYVRKAVRRSGRS